MAIARWYNIQEIVKINTSLNNDKKFPIYITDLGFVSVNSGTYYYIKKDGDMYSICKDEYIISKFALSEFDEASKELAKIYNKVLNKL